MSIIVVAATRPPTRLAGYLSCYLQQPMNGLWIGSLSLALQYDMAAAVERHGVCGFVAVASERSDSGITYPYFDVKHRKLLDVDGVCMIKKPVSVKES